MHRSRNCRWRHRSRAPARSPRDARYQRSPPNTAWQKCTDIGTDHCFCCLGRRIVANERFGCWTSHSRAYDPQPISSQYTCCFGSGDTGPPVESRLCSASQVGESCLFASYSTFSVYVVGFAQQVEEVKISMFYMICKFLFFCDISVLPAVTWKSVPCISIACALAFSLHSLYCTFDLYFINRLSLLYRLNHNRLRANFLSEICLNQTVVVNPVLSSASSRDRKTRSDSIVVSTDAD